MVLLPLLSLPITVIHGVTQLGKTLSVNDGEDQVELTMRVASPDHLLDAAVQALDECPRDNQRWVPRPASEDKPWPEHSSWLQSGARVVQEKLEVLGPEREGCFEYKQAVCNLV